MCFGRLKITHAVVEAAVATMVPRTQAMRRSLLRRCLSGSRAAIAGDFGSSAAPEVLQSSAPSKSMVQSISADAAMALCSPSSFIRSLSRVAASFFGS